MIINAFGLLWNDRSENDNVAVVDASDLNIAVGEWPVYLDVVTEDIQDSGWLGTFIRSAIHSSAEGGILYVTYFNSAYGNWIHIYND